MSPYLVEEALFGRADRPPAQPIANSSRTVHHNTSFRVSKPPQLQAPLASRMSNLATRPKRNLSAPLKRKPSSAVPRIGRQLPPETNSWRSTDPPRSELQGHSPTTSQEGVKKEERSHSELPVREDCCKHQWGRMEKALKEREEIFKQRLDEMVTKFNEQERSTREDTESRIQALRDEIVKGQVQLEAEQVKSYGFLDCMFELHEKSRLRETCVDKEVNREFSSLFWDIMYWVLDHYSNSDVSQEVLRVFDPTVKDFFATKIGTQWIQYFQTQHCVLLWAFIMSQLYEKILNSLLCGVSAEVAGLFTFVAPCSSRFPI